jgi:hypothetical protein
VSTSCARLEQAYHVGVDWRQDRTTSLLEPRSQTLSELVSPRQPREVDVEPIAGLGGDTTSLADPTAKGFTEPPGPRNERFRADDGTGISNMRCCKDSANATYLPMGAPIDLERHSDAESNGSRSSVSLE